MLHDKLQRNLSLIYTSDNEIYEDETAHALGVKHPDTVNYKDHLAMNEDKQLPFIPDYSGNLTLAPRPEAAGDAAKAWWNTQGLGKRLGGGKQSANPVTSDSIEAKQMTHEPEKPNPAQPFLQGVKDFIGGGVHQVLKNQGVQFPDWVEKAGDVVNNPDNQAAMGLFGGRFTPSAKSLAEAMEAKGFSEPSIKYMSGLERGSEGMWRLEMNDSASVFKGVDKAKPLDQVLKHDQLFARYPEARDVIVSLKPDSQMKNTRAYFEPGINSIVLRKSLSDEEKHSSLLHEVQHWIQKKEGFSFGHPDFLSSEEKKQFLDLIGNPENPDSQIYKHLASEVESRNVQRRMNMDPQETRQTLGKDTEYIDRLKQLTNRFGDQDIMNEFITDEFGNLSRTVGGGQKAELRGRQRPGTKPGTPSPLRGRDNWDPDLTKSLNELKDKGLTLAEIAKELGITRGQVAGKLFRQNLVK